MLLFCCGRFDIRFFVSKVIDQSLFLNIVEVREKLVVLLLLDGIVLVIVTACATDGEAKPHGGRRLGTIGDVLHAKLLGHDAAFGVGSVVAMECRRNALVESGVGK